jgi:molybdenum cofactor biosynthesis enzyme MoaA
VRTQRVTVTRRSRAEKSAADLPFAAVRDRILEAVGQGVESLVLCGGEPLLRADLPALIRVARAQGARALVLETDAATIGGAGASALKDAGVSALRVPIVTTSPERLAELLGGGVHPREIFRGLAASLDAGLEVVIVLPMAEGLPGADARLAGLRHAFPKLRSFELAPLRHGEAGPGAPLSPAALREQLGEAWKLGKKLEVSVELAPGVTLPPCIVDLPGGARRLLASQLRQEGEPNRAAPVCEGCALASRCSVSASDLERMGGASLARPITDASEYLRPGRSPGSRLKVLGAADVEKFFHVDYEFGADVHQATSRLGIIYRCNQVCTFCELADMDTDLSVAKIRAAIDASRARGSERLIVTGGEPTLSPDLIDHVRYAHEKGFVMIELQTNAVLLDRPGFAAELRAAGLTHAQISLHGPDSAISDRLTAAPGTHQRTLAGVGRLLDAGVHVLLNHLVFKDNCHLLVDFVDMVDRRWGEHRDKITIQFHSARNEFADRAESLAHIARYSDYAGTLRRAIDRARELGLRVYDLGDPTGIPSLCVLGHDEAYLGPILDQKVRPRFHAWESDWLTRVEACERCDAAAACMGVPRHYLALHGDAEFAPIKRRGPGSPEVLP